MKRIDDIQWLGEGGSARRGFTLIELLLSIALFAVVLAAINGVLYGALQLRNKTVKSLDQGVPLEHALQVMRRDFEGIVAPGGTMAPSAKSGAVTGVTTADTGFEFYANNGVALELLPWGDVQRVGYVLMQSTNALARGSKDLVRVVSRNLLASVQDTPDQQHLLSGVTSLDFQFYDGSQWKTSWDSTSEASILPRAVKVTLMVQAPMDEENSMTRRPMGQGLTYPVELVMPILVTGNTNQTQTATAGGGR